MNHKYAQFPQKPEEGIVYPRSEIEDWLWDVMDVLETEHDFSTKAFRVLNHWAIFPELPGEYFHRQIWLAEDSEQELTGTIGQI